MNNRRYPYHTSLKNTLRTMDAAAVGVRLIDALMVKFGTTQSETEALIVVASFRKAVRFEDICENLTYLTKDKVKRCLLNLVAAKHLFTEMVIDHEEVIYQVSASAQAVLLSLTLETLESINPSDYLEAIVDIVDHEVSEEAVAEPEAIAVAVEQSAEVTGPTVEAVAPAESLDIPVSETVTDLDDQTDVDPEVTLPAVVEEVSENQVEDEVIVDSASRFFDVLEALKVHFPNIAGGFARYTGGIDWDFIVGELRKPAVNAGSVTAGIEPTESDLENGWLDRVATTFDDPNKVCQAVLDLEAVMPFLYAVVAPGQDANELIRLNPEKAAAAHKAIYNRRPQVKSYEDMMASIPPVPAPKKVGLVEALLKAFNDWRNQ